MAPICRVDKVSLNSPPFTSLPSSNFNRRVSLFSDLSMPMTGVSGNCFPRLKLDKPTPHPESKMTSWGHLVQVIRCRSFGAGHSV